LARSNTPIYKKRVLTYKKLARCTAAALSILSHPRGQRGEFSNLRNAPVKFFMVTVINDECGNELLNSANFVPTDKKRKRIKLGNKYKELQL
jgi:hypothetical protein